MRRHTGDVLLNSSMTGAQGVVIIPTAFSSGQIGASLVNTAKLRKVVRLNLKDFKAGDRFCTYTLTGNEGEDFSRKVYVNGTGNNLPAGGPDDYASIKANSTIIGDEIRIIMPPLSAVYVLIEPGTKTLAINNEVTAAEVPSENADITIYPNPSDGTFYIKNLPPDVNRIEIKDMKGSSMVSKSGEINSDEEIMHVHLAPGIYFISFSGDGFSATRKLIIK